MVAEQQSPASAPGLLLAHSISAVPCGCTWGEVRGPSADSQPPSGGLVSRGGLTSFESDMAGECRKRGLSGTSHRPALKTLLASPCDKPFHCVWCQDSLGELPCCQTETKLGPL